MNIFFMLFAIAHKVIVVVFPNQRIRWNRIHLATVAKLFAFFNGMYGGELMTLQLQFDNKLIDVVMDRFGEKTICHKNSDNTFYINEEVQVAPTFRR